jgi:hypothetical protein
MLWCQILPEDYLLRSKHVVVLYVNVYGTVNIVVPTGETVAFCRSS